MKSILPVLILSIICISSCTDRNRNTQGLQPYQPEVIQIDFSKEYKQKKFSDINYSMTIQRLEENEKYPVGQIDKLIVDKDKIYILDRNKARALFIYNREGRLQHIINHTGSGPGQFAWPQDFDIDKKSGNIIIMDTGNRKFIFYSSKGEYIKEVKYNSMAVRFILDNEGNILLDNGNIPSPDQGYYLKKLDNNGTFLADLFPSDNSTIGMTFTPRNPFQRSDNQICYLPTLSNYIYAIEDNNAQRVYQIDFGKDWPSREFCESMKGIHPVKIRERIFENNYVCFLNFLQTREVLHIDFYKKKYYSFYYNKNTNQSLLIAMEEENISLPLATYGDEFIFVKYHDQTGEPTVVFYTINFDPA